MHHPHPLGEPVKSYPRLGILMVVVSIALLLDATVSTARAQSAPPPTSGTQQLHGHLSPAIKQAPFVAHLDLSTPLTLSIGLPLRNQDQLHTALSAIYDQRSAQYRHFLTPEQFAAAYGPSAQDYQAVVSFARSKGLTVNHTFNNRLLVAVSGTSENVERAFHVTMNTYKRPDGSSFHAPDREPSLDLSTPVLHIGGLENYILPHSPLRPVEHVRPMPNAGTAPNVFLVALISATPMPLASGSTAPGNASACSSTPDFMPTTLPCTKTSSTCLMSHSQRCCSTISMAARVPTTPKFLWISRWPSQWRRDLNRSSSSRTRPPIAIPTPC